MTGPRSERRRAPRFAASFPIRFEDGGVAREAQLRDLSEIGLSCSYPEFVREMTMVGISIQLPDDDRLHAVRGVVVRCEKDRDDQRRYEVAVYFTEVRPETRLALRSVSARAAESATRGR
jgi:hypothetical protein